MLVIQRHKNGRQQSTHIWGCAYDSMAPWLHQTFGDVLITPWLLLPLLLLCCWRPCFNSAHFFLFCLYWSSNRREMGVPFWGMALLSLRKFLWRTVCNSVDTVHSSGKPTRDTNVPSMKWPLPGENYRRGLPNRNLKTSVKELRKTLLFHFLNSQWFRWPNLVRCQRIKGNLWSSAKGQCSRDREHSGKEWRVD